MNEFLCHRKLKASSLDEGFVGPFIKGLDEAAFGSTPAQVGVDAGSILQEVFAVVLSDGCGLFCRQRLVSSLQLLRSAIGSQEVSRGHAGIRGRPHPAT